MTAPERGRIVECACCGRTGRNKGRGLVSGCWDRAARNRTLSRYPIVQHAGPDLIAAALELRRRHGRPGRGGSYDPRGHARPMDYGITWGQVAARLGVSPAALEKARERAGWPDVTII